MPDILIRGMEMPVEQPVTLILDPSGRVWLPDVKSSKEYMAKELPPHGDLCDRSVLLAQYDAEHVGAPGRARRIIENAPVIVPAERREE